MESFFEWRKRLMDPYGPWAKNMYAKYGIKAVLRMLYEPTPKGRGMQWDALWQHIVDEHARALPVERHHIDALMGSPDMRALHNFLAQTYGLKGENGKAVANSNLQQMWHQWLHYATGRKVYEVSPALAEYLKYTEFRGVTTDALRLPFKACYISVPSNADLSFVNDEKDQQDFRVPQVNPVSAVSVIEQEEPGNGGRRWNFLIVGAPGEVLDEKTGLRDRIIFSFDVFLRPGVPIEKALEEKEQSLFTAPEYLKLLYSEEGNTLAPFWRGFFRWVMSVMLYVTWPGAEKEEGWDNREARLLRDRIAKLPPSKKKDDLKERLKEMDKQPRIYLGMKMQALGVRRKLEAAGAERGTLLVRSLVTGHWRHQPFGPGRSERKLIWIRPFWRGPEEAPISNPERIILAPEEKP